MGSASASPCGLEAAVAASGGVDGGHMAWCAEGHVRVRVRVPCAVCVCVCRVRVHVHAAAVVAARRRGNA